MPTDGRDDASVPANYGTASIVAHWRELRHHVWHGDPALPPFLFEEEDEDESEEESLPPAVLKGAMSADPSPRSEGRTPQHIDGVLYPEVALSSSILLLADPSKEGQLVESVAIAWDLLLAELAKNPEFLSKLHWRRLEELVAAAYHKQGWTVTLTPRSKDGGVDVIAERADIGRLCVFDQVKHYTPNHGVSREEVDAMLGVIHRRANVSKGVITTTSRFAPGVAVDPTIAQYMPNRLELRDGRQLLELLQKLRKK